VRKSGKDNLILRLQQIGVNKLSRKQKIQISMPNEVANTEFPA
jgi:hypothetical protein